MKKELLLVLILLLFFIIGCGEKKETSEQRYSSVVVPEIKVNTEKKDEEISIKRDPFLPKSQQDLSKKNLVKINRPILSAVIYNSNRKLAVIGGKILKIGDKIDSKKLVEIRPEAVVLKKEKNYYLLELEKLRAGASIKETSSKDKSIPQEQKSKPHESKRKEYENN